MGDPARCATSLEPPAAADGYAALGPKTNPYALATSPSAPQTTTTQREFAVSPPNTSLPCHRPM